MLDEIPLPHAVGLGIPQQLAHGVQLVKAGEDQFGRFFAACFLVLILDNAGVFFHNAA